MIHDLAGNELDAASLYEILRLRSQVFVIEQESLYADMDGRDLDPGTRHLWIDADDGHIAAVARVLDGGDQRRIGRVVTAAADRGNGHAGRLIEHALATTTAPWVLDGQAHLAVWYERFGFRVAGPEYDDAGIPHVPMRRDH